jgi:glycosyltransferase involved in cell wall biosynthesis
VIVPVYNEEKSIGNVISDLLRLESEIPSLDIIVVDDGSTDKTQEAVKRFSSVRCLRHEKNMGKGAAIRTGANAAHGGVIVIQDADMEYPVAHIPRLVEPICSGGADVVYGSRFMGNCNGMGASHRFGNIVLSTAASILYGMKITDVMTGHKALSVEVFKSLSLTEKDFAVEVEMTSKILNSGWKILEVPIVYSRRKHGVAKIRYSDGLKCLTKLLNYKARALISRKNGNSQHLRTT